MWYAFYVRAHFYFLSPPYRRTATTICNYLNTQLLETTSKYECNPEGGSEMYEIINQQFMHEDWKSTMAASTFQFN